MGNILIKGLSLAHEEILKGNEGSWWEVGTTTLLGGVICEIYKNFVEGSSWGFIGIGVGDCKAYHISFKESEIVVLDITFGSRKESNDPSDPGGRLGPYLEGHPDLRNLDLWFHPVHEGDFILLCSDGVHDNLDPELLGVKPEELGLEAIWTELPKEKLQQVKTEYSTKLISKIVEELISQKCNNNISLLQPQDICNKIISHAKKITKSSRTFMETNPSLELPHDFNMYPGKLDHCTCTCIKVAKFDISVHEPRLDNLIKRMQHPESGLKQEKFQAKKVSTDGFESIQKGIGFKGKDLLYWLSHHDFNLDEATYNGQLLLDYKYIKALNDDILTFNPESTFQFEIFDPIMSLTDWDTVLKILKIKKFEKGTEIIKEGDIKNSLFQIIKGKCSLYAKVKDEVTLITILKESDTFNEISFLKGIQSPYTIIAEEDVEVFALDENKLQLIRVVNEPIIGRFYNYISKTLCRLFLNIEKEKMNKIK